MRTLAISALGFMLAAGSSAWAQSSYVDRDRDRDGVYSNSRSSSSDSYGGSRSNAQNGGYAGSSSGMDDDERSERHGRWGGHRSHHAWRSDRDHGDDHDKHDKKRHKKSHSGDGAKFVMKHGDKEFRVNCGDNDTTRECIDAALVLFREVLKAPHMAAAAESSESTSPTPRSSGSSTAR